MNWTALIGPAVVAAVVSGIVTIIGFLVNRSTLLKMHDQRLGADRDLAERKINADIALAERKFELDRSLADWKRRTELAEQVLADFYKAADIFAAARTPFAFGGEGETRARQDGESEVEQRHHDAIYAPFERLTKERDFFSEMQARRFRFMAVFGDGAAESFQAFVRNYNRIGIAVRALINDRQHLSDAMRTKFQGRIGWGLEEDDPIKLELDQAVSAIEAICRPVLQVRPV